MSCFHPIRAFSTASGSVSFSELARDQVTGDLKLPCGQCVGCRLDRARDWSLRIGHECKLHEVNWFVTLTYRDECLPIHGSLTYSDFQKFARRVRKSLGQFRFFVVGEYGEQLGRPHFHAMLFGLELPDVRKIGVSRCGRYPAYESKVLEALWGHGQVQIGTVTAQSAGYVARYSLKKVNGDLAASHYRRVTEDGEIVQITPEFCRMSTRPGIGAGWFEKYSADVTTHDYVIRDGSRNRVPRYYDKLFRRSGGELDVTKMERQAKARLRSSDNTPERLVEREIVQTARIQSLKRTLK